VQAGGSAARTAAEQVVDLARQRAADLLEANPDDVVLDAQSGQFHVAGTPARPVSWEDVAKASDDPLAAEVDYATDGATFPFGAHLAVVEIDRATGRVTLRRLVAVDDAGT